MTTGRSRRVVRYVGLFVSVTEQAGGSGRGKGARPEPQPLFAALDLGTNNCRLLIATPQGAGFRVVESFSRIVRLGDGLTRTGRLDDAAMERAMSALRICADKVRKRGGIKVKAVATQACRAAANGPEFVRRVKAETGLDFSVITPREEAQLSVAGCLNLLDHAMDAALVIDVGGGSTEFSWVDLKAGRERGGVPPMGAWLSVPTGVVTLAERFPEPEGDPAAWFRSMVDHVKADIEAFPHAARFRDTFSAGRAHLIGTSGAITSLAGLHLGLRRYERSRVDGLWLTGADCVAAADRLIAMGPKGRAGEPCIGPERADLVLAGAAILQAVQETWACERVRVADRGLREGILLSMMATKAPPKSRRRRRSRGHRPAMVVAPLPIVAP